MINLAQNLRLASVLLFILIIISTSACTKTNVLKERLGERALSFTEMYCQNPEEYRQVLRADFNARIQESGEHTKSVTIQCVGEANAL